MQLIKPMNGQNHFWLFEKDGRTLYTFHGILGESERTNERAKVLALF